ncbi:hypothetical protein [Cupriavidus taiwanensis]|uniref:Uncharacterized protein n=1 Tax=Cupriavidus taiwanensis TaxID=164546 RepID=A0A7Z7NR05_9BURK|nr:hypothetical protein [Cupriavidus taiwanensis]SOZ17211.1 conserved hypothetical protein [Cupriavidus taiwanensis]SOZ96462.1 conserved hypothetical protein [Cupriavidus taiwanensis]SPC25594.1 conserved hypothetical protein [Cupriavidus taiwanensis]
MNFDHLKRQFPDYDVSTLPEIPAGFGDTSWRNDACPSFTDEARGLQIFIDYAEAADREPNAVRYSLRELDGKLENIVDTNDWAELLKCISKYDKLDLPLSTKTRDQEVAEFLSQYRAINTRPPSDQPMNVVTGDRYDLERDQVIHRPCMKP